jgi:hypothetical protein
MLAEDPDVRGKTIGIVSAVAMDFTQGLVPMITPVWDIGLILPITEAVRLLMDLKAGSREPCLSCFRGYDLNC